MPAAKLLTYQRSLDLHRRRLIVDAARRVFENAGLEGASIRAIAEAAGCTTGAIYPHFRSKEEIFAVVLSESLSALSGCVETATAGITAPAKVIRRATLAIYKYYDAHPSELALALVLFKAEGNSKLGRGLEDDLKRQLEGLLALLASSIRKASSKAFAPMVRVEALALFSYLVGLLVLKHSSRIDVLGNNAAILLAHYTKSLLGRLVARR